MTTLPTFGVTYSQLEWRFSGIPFVDWETRVNHWIQQASADVARTLGMIGADYTIQDAEAAGEGELVYQTCQEFIEAHVAATIARSTTLEDPGLAEAMRKERERLRESIRSEVEGLMKGSFTTGKFAGSFRPTEESPPKRSSRRRRRRSIWSGGCL